MLITVIKKGFFNKITNYEYMGGGIFLYITISKDGFYWYYEKIHFQDMHF